MAARTSEESPFGPRSGSCGSVMKAYLDNDVVSAIWKDDNPKESAAIDKVLEAFDAGRLELVTSDVTRKEIDQYQGKGKAGVERIFRLLKKVPYVESHKLLGIHSYGDATTWISSPLIEDDPTVKRLRDLGIKPTDAHHVMVAIKAVCDIFLTCDGGILHHSHEIEKAFGIKPQSPSSLSASQGW
jgi:hypothetical protein